MTPSSSIKKVYKKKKLNPCDYVNKHTGELLSDETPNITSINVKNPDLVIIDTLEYMIIDTNALRFLQSILSKTDIEKIIRMADMVDTEYNILCDKMKKPYSTVNLRITLKIEEADFCRFMKRLYNSSVIYYMHGVKDNKRFKHVMLNPFFARKRKFFHVNCTQVFENLSEKKIKTIRGKSQLKIAA